MDVRYVKLMRDEPWLVQNGGRLIKRKDAIEEFRKQSVCPECAKPFKTSCSYQQHFYQVHWPAIKAQAES